MLFRSHQRTPLHLRAPLMTHLATIWRGRVIGLAAVELGHQLIFMAFLLHGALDNFHSVETA